MRNGNNSSMGEAWGNWAWKPGSRDKLASATGNVKCGRANGASKQQIAAYLRGLTPEEREQLLREVNS